MKINISSTSKISSKKIKDEISLDEVESLEKKIVELNKEHNALVIKINIATTDTERKIYRNELSGIKTEIEKKTKELKKLENV